ncbi:MAG: shikimate dehydrogenase family protein, partial [Candidatus Asgardarchaeia archaeon]
MNQFIRKTRLPLKFGLIGKPVEHSLSPLMMNTVFNELKINAIYVAFEVDELRFQDAIKGLSALKFSGFNVTIPYKEKIIEFCESISEKASIVNAVNTVKIIDGECLKCYNTDVDGVVATFKRRGID